MQLWKYCFPILAKFHGLGMGTRHQLSVLFVCWLIGWRIKLIDWCLNDMNTNSIGQGMSAHQRWVLAQAVEDSENACFKLLGSSNTTHACVVIHSDTHTHTHLLSCHCTFCHNGGKYSFTCLGKYTVSTIEKSCSKRSRFGLPTRLVMLCPMPSCIAAINSEEGFCTKTVKLKVSTRWCINNSHLGFQVSRCIMHIKYVSYTIICLVRTWSASHLQH